MKVVTICGSLRFWRQMAEIAYKLESEKGYCVLQCVDNGYEIQSEKSLNNLLINHLKKIDLSDAIYVVNINGFIGKYTQDEIAYAKSKGKKIIYHLEKDKRLEELYEI